MPTAIEQIYDQITQVLGGTNSSQVLTMLMPGTTLNAQTYAYDTTDEKPALVQQAESELTDQMFDLSKVSASSNGQRVSSQFMQALSVLIPNFNPLMPLVKDTLRDFLNTQMPANTTLNGAPFTGTFQQYYFQLYDNYIEKKIAWEQTIVDMQGELAKDPASEPEKYLEWYEQVAEGRLAEIDQALGKVLAVFAPSDMDAILGTLAAGPGGEVYEATNAVKDIQLASPDGGYFYPVELLPNDWFLDLASDLNPMNLLQDPEFIAVSITAKREALTASISQVQALVNSMPTQGDIKTAADNLTKAQSAYSTAQGALLNTYADNTATAVEMYLQNKANSSSMPTTSDLDTLANEAAAAKGDPQKGATTQTSTPITAADVQTLVTGQKTLIQAQSTLLSASQGLASAGVTLAAMQSGNFGDLPVILARLQAQLTEIVSLQSDLTNSFVAKATGANAIPTLRPAMSTADQQSAKDALTAAQGVIDNATAAAPATAAAVLTAITPPLKVNSSGTSSEPSLQPIYDAVKSASSSSAFSKKNELTAYALESNGSTDEKSEVLVENKKTHSAHSTAHSTDTKALSLTKPLAGGPAVGADLVALASAATAPTGEDALKALIQAVQTHANLPQAKQSAVSQRFMELQMSFSNSDMEDSSSVVSSSSQSSWSVDLFFGSASGSSSSSSSVTAKNSFDSSTEIKVGMKVAKVDIQRGWLDPGIFKLSKDMSRLSNDVVSTGVMPINKDGTHDWSNVDNMNKALFPAFPVAFIIAKDINLTFKATESSLAAVHSVVDSKSATGGGFLCFGGSSSSASHSDHSSTSVKSSGRVINISMPGPQILGWYLELTPADHSIPLTNASVSPATDASASDINILQFLNQLNALKATLLS